MWTVFSDEIASVLLFAKLGHCLAINFRYYELHVLRIIKLTLENRMETNF